MLDLIEYQTDILDKTIIDNSCGCGNFLVEIVRRFVTDGISKNISKRRIKNALQKCIWGCDIDERCVLQCIENLNNVASEFDLHNIKWNVFVCDGLYFDEIQFNYVVGNPPYISYLDLGDEEREKTKENFVSCSIGKFDYSYAFIEKGLQLLKPNGKMIMITPANMFKTVFAEKLRNNIKSTLTHIIDCSAKKIFNEVLTSPAITIYEKDCESKVLIYREFEATGGISERIIQKDALNGKWNFTNYIESGERRFGDLYKASNCVATLANKIFIHTEDEKGNIKIDVEPSILRTAKSPKSEQFKLKQKIIFPYYYQNGELKTYSEKELANRFPKLMKYMHSNKDILTSRDSDKNAHWYEYGRSQALRHINQKKLMISTIITKVVKVYELEKDVIPYSGIYIIPRNEDSLDDARLILQTQRFYNYLLTKGVKVSGDSIRISSKDIEEYRY